jgi:hypothetical protein
MWTVWRRDIDRLVGQGGPVSSPRRGYPSDLTDAQWALIEDLLPWQTVYWYFVRWE